MAGHAQLNFVMTECSKTQIRLTGLISKLKCNINYSFEKADNVLHGTGSLNDCAYMKKRIYTDLLNYTS